LPASIAAVIAAAIAIASMSPPQSMPAVALSGKALMISLR